MIEALTCCLEGLLGVTRTEISLSKKWTETAPEHLRDTSLADFLRKVSRRGQFSLPALILV